MASQGSFGFGNSQQACNSGDEQKPLNGWTTKATGDKARSIQTATVTNRMTQSTSTPPAPAPATSSSSSLQNHSHETQPVSVHKQRKPFHSNCKSPRCVKHFQLKCHDGSEEEVKTKENKTAPNSSGNLVTLLADAQREYNESMERMQQAAERLKLLTSSTEQSILHRGQPDASQQGSLQQQSHGNQSEITSELGASTMTAVGAPGAKHGKLTDLHDGASVIQTPLTAPGGGNATSAYFGVGGGGAPGGGRAMSTYVGAEENGPKLDRGRAPAGGAAPGVSAYFGLSGGAAGSAPGTTSAYFAPK